MTPTIAQILQQLNRPPSGIQGTIQNIMQLASQVGNGAVLVWNQLAQPLQQENRKIEYLLWKKMLYDHIVWLDTGQMKGLDDAIQDGYSRVQALQARAPLDPSGVHDHLCNSRLTSRTGLSQSFTQANPRPFLLGLGHGLRAGTQSGSTLVLGQISGSGTSGTKA